MAGAFGGADYRQTITLALQASGADQATIAADAIRDLEAAMAVLAEQFDGTSPKAFLDDMGRMQAQIQKLIPLTNEYGELQAALGVMQQKAAQETVAAQKAGIDARVRGTQAVRGEMDAVEQARVAAIKAMGDRAQAYARAEGAREQADRERHAGLEQQIADEAALQAALGRMEERQRSESHETAQQAVLDAGTAQRARIDALVSAEQAQERITARSLADREKYHNAVIAMAQAEARGYQDTTTATAGAAGALGGFATQAEKSAAKSRDMGFGMMSIAYAMDDIRYGIGAVINNVPMLAMAFGANPAWAAGISMVSIAIYEIGKAMTPVAAQYLRDVGLMTDETRKLVISVEDGKAKLGGGSGRSPTRSSSTTRRSPAPRP